MPSRPTWLLFLYQLPARPSTQRVYVWRRLKACGAFYLQNSVCVLPDRATSRQQAEQLRDEIVARKGEARFLAISLTDAADDAAMMARFREQSEEEYTEVQGKCRDFHTELKNERAREHFTFAELEENEEELAKIEAWMAKVQARDFFEASVRTKVSQAIAGCRRDLERYRLEVAKAQGVQEGTRKANRSPGGR